MEGLRQQELGEQAQKTLNDVVKGVGALAGKYRGDDACWRVDVLIDGHDTSTTKNTSQRTIPSYKYRLFIISRLLIIR